MQPASLRPLTLALCLAAAGAPTWAVNLPVSPAQQETAARVAQAGVPLSELAANAPDRYTVKRGDTLWDISTLFLKSPWRWPELWGMNREQVRNPHLIYPGQELVLIRKDGRAMLQFGEGAADGGRLVPRVRSSDAGSDAIGALPPHLIEAFLNEAVVFDSDELERAPRIVAAPENRVLMTQGDLAYVRGMEATPAPNYRVFRRPTPLKDPQTGAVLGYEARYVASADFTRPGGRTQQGKDSLEVPATITLGQVRGEVVVGDRLAPVPPREFSQYVISAPEQAMEGRIISVYGDALIAGQNQIVSLNRGTADGLRRGHVLALWRAGRKTVDRTAERAQEVQLPDEQHGRLLVFRTFKRVSYALIVQVKEPVNAGDRFTQP